MSRKYYAYGTYSENGKLYTKDGKEIKQPEKYYEVCRKNYQKKSSTSEKNGYKKTYSSSKTNYNNYGGWKQKKYYNDNYESWQERNMRERENAHNAGIEGVEYMSDEEYELFDLGYLTEDDF